MALKIPVAHDFTCPWCWIALSQVRRLQAEFDVEFDWLGYELYPEGLAFPESVPRAESDDRPPRPSRLDLAYRLEGMSRPVAPRPPEMRCHNALEAVEHAKRHGDANALVARLYEAYWERGQTIDDPTVIAAVAEGLVDDVDAMRAAIEGRVYRNEIVGFDDPAYAQGVYYVPTFWIAGDRYAEQPYAVLRDALAGVMQPQESFYRSLSLPDPPADRPYVLTNMVATIDGKTLDGDRHDGVLDLGSKADHESMHRIERQVDAVMIGAATLRASPSTWRPRCPGRVVITSSGDLPWDSAFLNREAGDRFIVTPEGPSFGLPAGLTPIAAGRGHADLATALAELRRRGVKRLLVEGGSELNAQLLAADLVDELFLTVAPKVKLGRDTPTYAGGEPLAKENLLRFKLLEEHRVGNEVFLRYRRA